MVDSDMLKSLNGLLGFAMAIAPELKLVLDGQQLEQFSVASKSHRAAISVLVARKYSGSTRLI